MKFKLTRENRTIHYLPKIFGMIVFMLIVYIFLSYVLAVKFIQDDAFTSLRYVRNFLDGKGLVFNEGEHVEGFTNFLWVMILSGIGFTAKVFRFPVALENAAQFLSIMFGVAVLIVTYLLLRLITFTNSNEKSIIGNLIDEMMSLLPVFLIAYSTPMIYWSVSGMETSLFVTLTLLSIYIYVKNENGTKPNVLFAVVSLLNSFVRPEGMFFFGMILLHRLVYNFLQNSEGPSLQRIKKSFDKKVGKEIIFYVVPLLLFTAFRVVYYGYPFPNTFYAKTEFTMQFLNRGLIYFLDFASVYLLSGILLLVPFIFFVFKIRQKEISLFLLIIFSWIVVIVILGGDVLPINRFFLPIMPLIFILVVKTFQLLIVKFFGGNKPLQCSVSIVIVTVIVTWCIFVFNQEEKIMLEKRSYEIGLVTKMKIYAEWVTLQSETQKREITVVMSTIGAFSYYSNAKVIDLVGLTDSYIAHHPKETEGISDELPVLWKERHYNADYILLRQPDYMIFPAGAKPSAFAECAVFVQPEFWKQYYTQIFYSEKLNQLLPVFTRRSDEVESNTSNCKSCSVKFIKHYILANNYFLDLIHSGSNNLLNLVLAECDSVLLYCPLRLSDALTIKGYAYFHFGDVNKAEEQLDSAARLDPSNSVARFYLKSIYAKKGETDLVVKMISEIKKFSPDAFPNLVVQ